MSSHPEVKSAPMTLKARVVEEVREAILSGFYAPGDRLNEAQLAYKFNVSRIPIREALIQLQESGLVMNYERRGLCVTKLSEDDIRRINSVRLVLESEAIWLAREQMDSQIRAELENVLARMERTSDLLAEIVPLDIEFHRLIWRASGNPYLARSLDALVAQLFAYKTLEHQVFARSATRHARDEFRAWRVGQHRDLFHVLIGKSDIEPEMAMLAHLRAGFDEPDKFCSISTKGKQASAPIIRRPS